MKIETLMEDRAVLTAQMSAVPTDLAHEKEFKEIFDKRWAVEESILSDKAVTLADRDAQITVLADRARDADDMVEHDLRRLAAG